VKSMKLHLARNEENYLSGYQDESDDVQRRDPEDTRDDKCGEPGWSHQKKSDTKFERP